MKKVLIVATVIHFLGFERNDIKLLKELGYEVHCAANLQGEQRTKDIEMIRHQIDFTRSPFSKQTIIAYKQLKKLMDDEQFDVIHCHTPVGGTLARIAAHRCRKKDIKVIYTAHGFHFFKGAPLKNWLIYYPVEKFLSRWTDVLITINKEDYERAKKNFNAKKVEYIPGVGIDTNSSQGKLFNKELIRKVIEIPKDSLLLVSVGEVNKNKNHQLVMKALGEIKNKSIYYVVCGKGSNEYVKYLKDLCNKLSISENVKLLGFRTDIIEILSAADVFVFPSLREGLGLAALEAMMVGLPLITSNIHGIKDYSQQGKSGCLVSPNSVEEMKLAILQMYSDEEFRLRCGKANIETVEKFDIRTVEKIMLSIYEEI